MYQVPDVAVTDAGGTFITQITFQGKITDSKKVALGSVNLTIPYSGKSITGVTDKFGEFITTKIPAAGTVVNAANEPVKSAMVAIKTRIVSDTADSSGKFSNGSALTGTIVPFLNRHNRQTIVGLVGNRLFVAAAAGQRVDVSLFTMKGERCFSGSVEKLSNERQPLAMPRLAAGSYIMKVAFRETNITFKRTLFTTNRITIERMTRQSPAAAPSGTLAKRSAVGITDTLVAFADGYLVSYLPLPGGDLTGLKITLQASGAWKPATAADLVREGSMIKIKAKDHNFSMGTPIIPLDNILKSEWQAETPAHKVSFTYDFWMDSTEITQKQYSTFMQKAYKVINFMYTHTRKDTTGTVVTDTLRTNNYKANLDSVLAIDSLVLVKTDTAILPLPQWNANYGLSDNTQSYHIGLGDAIMFCNARSKAESLDTVYSYSKCTNPPGSLCALKTIITDMSKNGYRLPTEPEWEYACRGGTESDYYWGKNYKPYPSTKADTTEISANCLWGYNSNKSAEAADYALKSGVASKLPNKYGLYDMLGSCNEWISIPLSSATYKMDAITDPKTTTAAGDTLFNKRGGNWGNDPVLLRSACRKFVVANYPYWQLGFRTVREVR